jgi:hypothetical protein
MFLWQSTSFKPVSIMNISQDFLKICIGNHDDDAIYLVMKFRSGSFDQYYELWCASEDLEKMEYFLEKIKKIDIADALLFGIGSFQASFAGDAVALTAVRKTHSRYGIAIKAQHVHCKEKQFPDHYNVECELTDLEDFAQEFTHACAASGTATLRLRS